jgi:NAD(P)-dependent dehydrogenase (short-subunit alcohol dehydrogenase family)
VASIALLREPDEALLAACRDEDEPRALAHRVEDGHLAYTSAKLALARWVRRQAPEDDWAGAGIALNAVAPGVIDTPMTTYLLGTEERRAETAELMPQPLGGFGAPEHVASLIAWLASAENGFVTGQVVFVDGGYEALARGGRAWP